jgi:glycosyltransferase involved in cell wall biosynthesis
MIHPRISVISPIYGAEKIIDELVRQIIENLKPLTTNFEIILVDDCGPDNSWKKIEENCKKHKYVKGIKLSRNFGQHYAITAGIDFASGDYLIIMDCDLQDDPKYFKHLLTKANQGFDIVYTYKTSRKHSFFKNVTAKMYNSIFNFLVENNTIKSDVNIGAYSLITRKVADAFKSYNDYHIHYLMVLRWLGYSSGYIEIEHTERFEGVSSYTFRKLLKHGITGIISQSDRLLRIFIGIGLSISTISFLSILSIIIMYFVNGFKSGWASIIVILLFSTGIILIGIGTLGIYLGKTFEQTKNRPKYLIDKRIN